MVTQASQLPPDTEFATKADLENVVQTLSREFRLEIGASEQRLRADFTAALEASEQRLRADFAAALEASEQRLRADFTAALEASEQRLRSEFERDLNYAKKDILLELEKAKVTTSRWIVGTTVTLSIVMTGTVLAAIISLA